MLVADGDPAVRRLVVAVLTELGHETREAPHGGEAWRTFEEWQPELVVLDVDLAVVDGLEVCRRIREFDDKREVFVLFLTGRDHPETLETVLDAGGDEFIAKPTTPEDLRARLIVARRRMAQDMAASYGGRGTLQGPMARRDRGRRRSRCSTRSTIRSPRSSATPS